MLQPRKVLFQNVRKGRNRGKARSNYVVPGKWEYAIKCLENGLIRAKQLDDICVLIKRSFSRGSDMRLAVFPSYPKTTKPLGTRMGSGKGPLSSWNVKAKAGTNIVLVKGMELSELKRIVSVANSRLKIKVGLSCKKNYLYNSK